MKKIDSDTLTGYFSIGFMLLVVGVMVYGVGGCVYDTVTPDKKGKKQSVTLTPAQQVALEEYADRSDNEEEIEEYEDEKKLKVAKYLDEIRQSAISAAKRIHPKRRIKGVASIPLSTSLFFVRVDYGTAPNACLNMVVQKFYHDDGTTYWSAEPVRPQNLPLVMNYRYLGDMNNTYSDGYQAGYDEAAGASEDSGEEPDYP